MKAQWNSLTAPLRADAFVIATGAEPRKLPGQPAQVHTLRTLDGSLSLRSALQGATSLLVVGGGFIGAEVASGAVARGLRVTSSRPCRCLVNARSAARPAA